MKIITCLIIVNFTTALFVLHVVRTAHGTRIEASKASECLIKLGHHAIQINDKLILNSGIGGRIFAFGTKTRAEVHGAPN